MYLFYLSFSLPLPLPLSLSLPLPLPLPLFSLPFFLFLSLFLFLSSLVSLRGLFSVDLFEVVFGNHFYYSDFKQVTRLLWKYETTQSGEIDKERVYAKLYCSNVVYYEVYIHPKEKKDEEKPFMYVFLIAVIYFAFNRILGIILTCEYSALPLIPVLCL